MGTQRGFNAGFTSDYPLNFTEPGSNCAKFFDGDYPLSVSEPGSNCVKFFDGLGLGTCKARK